MVGGRCLMCAGGQLLLLTAKQRGRFIALLSMFLYLVNGLILCGLSTSKQSKVMVVSCCRHHRCSELAKEEQQVDDVLTPCKWLKKEEGVQTLCKWLERFLFFLQKVDCHTYKVESRKDLGVYREYPDTM